MKNNKRNKLIAFLLVMVIFIATINIPVKATNTGKNVNLGTKGFINPNKPTAATDSWGKGQGSYIYFGTYPQSDSSGATKEPIRFRILNLNSDSNGDGTTEGIFILSDKALDKIKFNTTRNNNIFTSSNLKKWLNSEASYTGGHSGGFLNTAFSVSEQKVILSTSWNEDENAAYVENNKDPLIGSDLKGEKIFVLSAKEATNSNYGFFKTALSKSNKTQLYQATNYSLVGRKYSYTWLRSPVKNYSSLVGMNLAHSSYTNATFDNYYTDTLLGVVPAMNINKSSILFNTAKDYKKGNFAVVNNDKVSSDWNITLQDGSGFMAIRKPGEITEIKPGATVTVQIKSLPTNASCTYSQISAMLVDSNGNIACYGKISSNLSDTEIKVNIPTTLPTSNYKMYVFAEDVNSTNGNLTDYASNMVELKSTKLSANSVAIKNLTIPNANESFNPSALCNTTGVKNISSVVLKQNNSTVTGKLKYSTDYCIEITINALDNYAFNSSTTATVNGQNAKVKFISESSIIVQYPFTTANEPPTEPPTEAPTEAPTQAPTEPPTEAPTEVPTEVSTETPTVEPTTQAATKEPTTPATSNTPSSKDSDKNFSWLWILILLLAGGSAGAIGYKIKSKKSE